MAGASRVPELYKPKEALRADKLNQLAEFARNALIGVNAPRQLNESGIRQSPVVQQFEFVEEFGDYFSAYPITGNPDTDATLVLIAKPPLLRNSIELRNSISYVYSSFSQRIATGLVGTETQVVVPSYVAGDVIIAIRSIVALPLVFSGTQSNTQEEIPWYDLNCDGRAWAKKKGT